VAVAVSEAKSYGVKSLSNTSCVFAQGIAASEPYLLGDDRSPLVVGATGLYYVSDDVTSNFDPSNITLRSTSTTLIDGLFSDLGEGSFWTFATSSTTWFSFDVADVDPSARITHLIPLVPDTDGALVTDWRRGVVLSANPYSDDYETSQPSVFLGMGELVFAAAIDGPSDEARVFLVTVATGHVTRIQDPAESNRASWTTSPPATLTRNWARWGVMERSAGSAITLLAAGRNSKSGATDGGIYRYNLDGSVRARVYRHYLGDAATFTVNYWQAGRANRRWFTHGKSVPSDIATLTQSEWVLSCKADHWHASGAAIPTPCYGCSLLSTMWSSFFSDGTSFDCVGGDVNKTKEKGYSVSLRRGAGPARRGPGRAGWRRWAPRGGQRRPARSWPRP
jgi:hypothetical protein